MGVRPARDCSLCGTPNPSGTNVCATCGTLLPPWGAASPAGWRASFGRDPASGIRAMLALPFFLVAAFAAGILGLLPVWGLWLVFDGAGPVEAFTLWAIASVVALGVMVAAGGLGLVIRGRAE